MPNSEDEETVSYYPHTGRMPSYYDGDCFDEYLLQIEFFFEANRIKGDADKRATLLTCIGKKVFSILRNLLQPRNLKDVPYNEIIEVLKNHFSPQTSTIMERFRFYNVKQTTEDISSFIVRIKEHASRCNFGTFLDEAIRDKLVCGLLNQHIQNKLLSERELNFSKACEIALAMEAANKEAKSLNFSDGTNVLKIASINKSIYRNKIAAQNNDVENSKYESHYQRNKKNLSNSFKKCKCCGKTHRDECTFKNAMCYKCKRKGHIATVCRVNLTNFVDRVDETIIDSTNNLHIDEDNEVFVDSMDGFYINTVSSSSTNICDAPKPYLVSVDIGGIPVRMQIDSGSAHTIMSLNHFKNLHLNGLSHLKIPVLRTYSGELLHIVGRYMVPVKFAKKNMSLPLVVIKAQNRPTLMGRFWMEQLRVGFDNYKSLVGSVDDECNLTEEEVEHANFLKCYKVKFPNCFSVNDSNGILGEPVNIAMKEDTVPIFCKSRPVPYAMRQLVDSELDKLICKGIVKRVSYSKWATPIVAVPKVDSEGKKSVRICGDFSVTINKFCETQFYPLPSQEDILTNIGSALYFSKIDLSMAFHQLPIASESQELLTLNTPKGLLRYTRLPFGIKSASFLFQQKMDSILKEFSFTDCYIDDLFIRASTKEECKYRTELVLHKLHSYNVKINVSKCEFFKKKIKILGHIKDTEGIHPIEEKCNDILMVPVPTNVTELKSYLGLLGYYQHFIPNLATKLKPLYKLLEKNTKWDFNEICMDAFKKSKTFLTQYNILIHYDMSKPIVLQCDASDYGLGVVLCHELSPGFLRPIFFASKTLSKAEQNYAHIHKEALAIIFGIKRFNKYLQGQKFVIETDAKPLLTLLGHDKQVPEMANSRMQRWSLILSSYDYILKYKKGSDLILADALSRLPCNDDEPVDKAAHEFVCYFSEFENLTGKDIEKASAIDNDISQAINFTKFGWPQNVPNSLHDFYKIKNELSIEDNCLLRANRLVIPKSLQEKVLQLLHIEHPGIVRMKHLARGYFWFPNMDREIENHVNRCIPCQMTRPNATKVFSNWWPLTGKPFERIHIDYAELENQNLLIIKDSYSKWIDVFMVNNTNSRSTIHKLRSFFSCFGFPGEIVSDNAAQFKSDEFVNFFKSNGIVVRNSPPYHPNSNGAAEKSVNIVKNMLKKQKFSNQVYDSFQHRIDNAMFVYRNTPSSVTLKSPTELIFKFTPQTRITKLRSDHLVREKNYQEYQKSHFNQSSAVRNFDVGEGVWVRSVRNKEIKWFPGEISKIISTNTYLVNVNGQVRFVHADHLRKCMINMSERQSKIDTEYSTQDDSNTSSCAATSDGMTNSPTCSNANDNLSDETSELDVIEKPDSIKTDSIHKEGSTPKNEFQLMHNTPRPKRTIRPPNRLNL